MSWSPEDPVREAVGRYFQRFPELGIAHQQDAVSHALFKLLERSLVQADIAMQDEGLDARARRRVVTAALYGSVDEDAAVERLKDQQVQQVQMDEAMRTVWPQRWER